MFELDSHVAPRLDCDLPGCRYVTEQGTDLASGCPLHYRRIPLTRDQYPRTRLNPGALPGVNLRADHRVPVGLNALARSWEREPHGKPWRNPARTEPRPPGITQSCLGDDAKSRKYFRPFPTHFRTLPVWFGYRAPSASSASEDVAGPTEAPLGPDSLQRIPRQTGRRQAALNVSLTELCDSAIAVISRRIPPNTGPTRKPHT
jgi:hypothetical protein